MLSLSPVSPGPCVPLRNRPLYGGFAFSLRCFESRAGCTRETPAGADICGVQTTPGQGRAEASGDLKEDMTDGLIALLAFRVRRVFEALISRRSPS